MSDFFLTLTQILKEFTTADTANIFLILESAATVVAAIGAIIAIIVTWRIASNQIKLMKDQIKIEEEQKKISVQQGANSTEQTKISKVQAEISAVQANISLQQNKIALYGVRAEVYEKSRTLFDFWGTLNFENFQQFKTNDNWDFLTYCISIRELNVVSADYKKKKWEELIQRQSGLFRDDIFQLKYLGRLFPITNEQNTLLNEIITAYEEFENAICVLKSPKDSTKTVEEKFFKLQQLANSQNCSDLDATLLTYITFREL